MSTEPLPDINFDGKIVKAKSGAYKCPYKCYTGSYAAPKWKTVKGFHKHMADCPCSPPVTKRKADEAAALAIVRAEQAQAAAARLGLTLGDQIFYATYRVTQPTHVQKFNRSVRVRYEEGRYYYAAAAVIESFDFLHSLILNGHVREADLRPSLAQAKLDSDAQQKAYQESCDFAAMCR